MPFLDLDSVLLNNICIMVCKQELFENVSRSILLYGCTPRTFMKSLKKAWSELYKAAAFCFKQQPIKKELYGN